MPIERELDEPTSYECYYCENGDDRSNVCEHCLEEQKADANED